VNDMEKGAFDYERDARMCSLSSSGNKRDLILAEELARNSEFYCLTCKRSAADPERLCSPALEWHDR
jgi:hypothetical protein